MRSSLASLALAAALLGSATPAPAQIRPGADAEPPPIQPLWALAASGGVPGLGQWVQGQRRAWAYAGLEVLGWWVYFDGQRRGDDRREAYRELAWLVGRGAPSPRLDGDFDYYERMSKFERSGAFDADPLSPGIQPETTAGTYNGEVWRLARGIFLGSGAVVPDSPGYQRALDYYFERAYAGPFLWDWTDRGADQRRYSDLIHQSDDAFRTATTAVGLVLGNHVVSALDAFLSARLPVIDLNTRLEPGTYGPQAAVSWTFQVRVP